MNKFDERKFNEIFNRAKSLPFDHEYEIISCNIPEEPEFCSLLQKDKKTGKIGETLIGKEGAITFALLSPICPRRQQIIR